MGGFSVILGGYFIDKSQVRIGKFIIGVGAGMGIPSLLLTLFTLIAKQDFSMVIAQHGINHWLDRHSTIHNRKDNRKIIRISKILMMVGPRSALLVPVILEPYLRSGHAAIKIPLFLWVPDQPIVLI